MLTENIRKASWKEILCKSWDYCVDSFIDPDDYWWESEHIRTNHVGTFTYNKLIKTAILLSLITVILCIVL